MIDIMQDLRKGIARGVCSFRATINLNRDGNGSYQASEPLEPCVDICDDCWHMANHILKHVEDFKYDIEQSTKITRRANRKA
jgi:hypothetical protein